MEPRPNCNSYCRVQSSSSAAWDRCWLPLTVALTLGGRTPLRGRLISQTYTKELCCLHFSASGKTFRRLAVPFSSLGFLQVMGSGGTEGMSSSSSPHVSTAFLIHVCWTHLYLYQGVEFTQWPPCFVQRPTCLYFSRILFFFMGPGHYFPSTYLKFVTSFYWSK